MTITIRGKQINLQSGMDIAIGPYLYFRYHPMPDFQTFAEAAARDKLLIKRCKRCGNACSPARIACPKCISCELNWEESKGEGTVYTFTIVRQALSDAWNNKIPYVVALIQLTEGVYMLSHVVDADIDRIHVGMPVKVTFREFDGMKLPAYCPK